MCLRGLGRAKDLVRARDLVRAKDPIVFHAREINLSAPVIVKRHRQEARLCRLYVQVT